MKLSSKTFFKMISVIIYILLLPWPVYVFLFYMIFPDIINYITIILSFVIEFALGIFLIIKQFKKQKEIKKTGSRIIFIVLLISFAVYGVSAVYYLVQVLLRSL